jgi:hypothetical protein
MVHLRLGGSFLLTPDTVAMLGEAERSSLDIDSYGQPGLGPDAMDDPVMQYAGRAWAKNGSTGDYNSYMEMLPDQKPGVIVLTHSDTLYTEMVTQVLEYCRTLQRAVIHWLHELPDFRRALVIDCLNHA